MPISATTEMRQGMLVRRTREPRSQKLRVVYLTAFGPQIGQTWQVTTGGVTFLAQPSRSGEVFMHITLRKPGFFSEIDNIPSQKLFAFRISEHILLRDVVFELRGPAVQNAVRLLSEGHRTPEQIPALLGPFLQLIDEHFLLV